MYFCDTPHWYASQRMQWKCVEPKATLVFMRSPRETRRCWNCWLPVAPTVTNLVAPCYFQVVKISWMLSQPSNQSVRSKKILRIKEDHTVGRGELAGHWIHYLFIDSNSGIWNFSRPTHLPMSRMMFMMLLLAAVGVLLYCWILWWSEGVYQSPTSVGISLLVVINFYIYTMYATLQCVIDYICQFSSVLVRSHPGPRKSSGNMLSFISHLQL